MNEIPTGIDPRDRKFPSFKLWLFGGSWGHKYGNGGTVAHALHKRMYYRFIYPLVWRLKHKFRDKSKDSQGECCQSESSGS